MPMYIRFFKAEKSFNPSVDHLFSLRISRKVAEGFAFQTLQTLQPTLQPDPSASKRPDTSKMVSSQGPAQAKQPLGQT